MKQTLIRLINHPHFLAVWSAINIVAGSVFGVLNLSPFITALAWGIAGYSLAVLSTQGLRIRWFRRDARGLVERERAARQAVQYMRDTVIAELQKRGRDMGVELNLAIGGDLFGDDEPPPPVRH